MRTSSRSSQCEVPTSPTADIAFLLIIFFMLTAAFTATRGLDVALPEEEEVQEVDPVDAIHLRIRANGGLELDGTSTAVDDVLERLRTKLQLAPRKPVILHTDPDAPYASMVGVLDRLRQGRKVLDLEHEINIAVPTLREINALWPSGLSD